MTIVNTQFTITARGYPSPTYQWYIGGEVNPEDRTILYPDGQHDHVTTRVLDIYDVSNNMNGNQYSCKVTNSFGSVWSDLAELTVLFEPVFTLQPLTQEVDQGETITLTVTTDGNPAATYIWKLDGVTISNGGRVSGATTATIVITAAEAADDGDYTCVATNSQGSATSSIAVVTVNLITPYTSGFWSYNSGFAFDPSGNGPISQIGGFQAFLNYRVVNVSGLQVYMQATAHLGSYSDFGYQQFNGLGITNGANPDNSAPQTLSNLGAWLDNIAFDSNDKVAIYSSGYSPLWIANIPGDTDLNIEYWITVSAPTSPNNYDVTVRIKIASQSIDHSETVTGWIFTGGAGLLNISGGFTTPNIYGVKMVVNAITIQEI